MRILLKGSIGNDVTQLQSSLRLSGYDPGPIDGVFGQKTTLAVIQFQKDHGLVKDGIVGQITWGQITTPISALRTHMIQPGDTLYKIAQAYSISLSDLLTINPGVDPKKLLTGQLILLFGITYPSDGAVLPYGDVNITWVPIPGATGYRISVTDKANPYVNGYQADVSADTHSFILTTNNIISGHNYMIYVFSTIPESSSIYHNYGSTVNVTIGESAVKPLIIKSPVQNATIAQGEPVNLIWDEPTDASGYYYNEISVTTINGVETYREHDGSLIPSNLLTPGKHHITVKLISDRNDVNILYQGSTDITIVSS